MIHEDTIKLLANMDTLSPKKRADTTYRLGIIVEKCFRDIETLIYVINNLSPRAKFKFLTEDHLRISRELVEVLESEIGPTTESETCEKVKR